MENVERIISPTLIEMYKKEDINNFTKMYPNINYNEKYILWINLKLFWEYLADSIEIEIEIDGIENFNSMGESVSNQGLLKHSNHPVPRHLVPNQKYSTACMKNGRKRCDAGIVLYFDSFEELSRVNEITITWHIKNTVNTKSGLEDYIIQAIYHLSYNKDDEKKIYTLTDCVTRLADYLEDEDETRIKNYRKKYKTIYIIDEEDDLTIGERTISMFYHWFRVNKDFNYAEQLETNIELEPAMYKER